MHLIIFLKGEEHWKAANIFLHVDAGYIKVCNSFSCNSIYCNSFCFQLILLQVIWFATRFVASHFVCQPFCCNSFFLQLILFATHFQATIDHQLRPTNSVNELNHEETVKTQERIGRKNRLRSCRSISESDLSNQSYSCRRKMLLMIFDLSMIHE